MAGSGPAAVRANPASAAATSASTAGNTSPQSKADAVRDCADDGRAEHDADVAHRHHPPERLRAAPTFPAALKTMATIGANAESEEGERHQNHRHLDDGDADR